MSCADLLQDNSNSSGISHINGNDLLPLHWGEACHIRPGFGQKILSLYKMGTDDHGLFSIVLLYSSLNYILSQDITLAL